ncbi:hypothetical protein T05_10455, partial [Trichinella murrelli]
VHTVDRIICSNLFINNVNVRRHASAHYSNVSFYSRKQKMKNRIKPKVKTVCARGSKNLAFLNGWPRIQWRLVLESADAGTDPLPSFKLGS